MGFSSRHLPALKGWANEITTSNDSRTQYYRAANAAVSSRQAGVSRVGRGSERSMNSLCHRS